MDHKHDHSHGHHDHDHGTHGGAPAQADPGKAIDPVCGMQVTIKPEARHRDYEGQTFYFCSDGCQSKFDGDPWFYASGAAAKVEKSAPAGTQWTCPMHPEIVRDEPGACTLHRLAVFGRPEGGAWPVSFEDVYADFREGA